MVIEKVHGLQTTGMTLDQRFTLLASAAPDRVIRQKRQTVGSFLNQSLNIRNRNLIQEIARQLEYQAQKQALRDRIGMRQQQQQQGLRRFGSESSLVGLRRANSFGNLTQQGVKSRLSWRQSNGNISNRSRSVSVSSAPGGRGFNFRRPRRGGQQRALRGRFWNFRNRYQFGQLGRVTRVRGRGARRGGQRGRGQGRGGNRAGMTRGRAQTPKPKRVPTREELDAQLDQYMAGTKAALDKELDEYMKDAMDLE